MYVNYMVFFTAHSTVQRVGVAKKYVTGIKPG